VRAGVVWVAAWCLLG